MPNEFPAADAYVLPNMFAPLGDTLNNAISLKERKSERDAAAKQQEYERQQRENQQNKLYNLGQINKETDLSNFKPITQQVDEFTTTQLSKIRQNAIDNYSSLDPREMESRITNDMSNFLRWHSAAQSTAQNIEKGLTDFNKKYPGIPSNVAHDYAMNNFANDYLTQDKNGSTVPVDPLLIKQRDYVGEMNNPQFIGQNNKDASGFINYLQDTKPTPISAEDTKVRDASGRLTQLDISGGVTPFKELVKDANGVPTDLKTKADYISIGKDANGSPIKLPLLPDEQVGLIKSQSPNVFAGALQLWNERKLSIEKSFAEKGLLPINSVTEDLLFRNFLYNFIDKSGIDQSHLTTKSADEQRMPRISINVGGKDISINDVYGEINSKGANVLANGFIPFNELSNTAQQVLAKGLVVENDKKLGVDELAVSKDKDGNWVLSNVETVNDGSVKKIKDLYKITYSGINLPANTSQKQKQVILHNQQSTGKKKIEGF